MITILYCVCRRKEEYRHSIPQLCEDGLRDISSVYDNILRVVAWYDIIQVEWRMLGR